MSSPLASTLCAIPGTSEGVGIGARVVIYTQTLLFFTTALWILWNGKVTQGGLDHARSQLATSLFFPLAILISSLISASNLNFTNYDGVIALSLSLISSASSFAYLILFIHHKVGLRNGQGRVDASWKAWGRNLLEAYSGRRYVYHLVGFLDEPTFAGKTISSHASGGDAELGTSPIQQTPVGSATKSSPRLLFKRFALAFGSIQLTLTAALGIWLWSDLASFGSLRARRSSDLLLGNMCAIEYTTLSILGQYVALVSPGLRIASLIMYPLILIPGLNLVMPLIPFIATCIGWRCWTRAGKRSEAGGSDNTEKSFMTTKVQVQSSWRRGALPAFVSLGFLLTGVLVLIVDIELTLRVNLGLQSGNSFADWGFAQILAVLSLVFPLASFFDSVFACRFERFRREP